jgi:hypothetical protein
MRWSEIEQDIILWKRRSQQLLDWLSAFTPPSELSSLFAYDFFFGHLMSFFPLRTHTYISRYRFSLRVYRSIKVEIAYRSVFGKLETGSTRLARYLRDLWGDVEAKEGVPSG